MATKLIFAPLLFTDGGTSVEMRMWYVGALLFVWKILDLSLQNTNKHVRLTRNKPSMMVHISICYYSVDSKCVPQGWLWSRLPLTAYNWVIEVEFKVRGSLRLVLINFNPP